MGCEKFRCVNFNGFSGGSVLWIWKDGPYGWIEMWDTNQFPTLPDTTYYHTTTTSIITMMTSKNTTIPEFYTIIMMGIILPIFIILGIIRFRKRTKKKNRT